jgi:hypothetical protein
MPALKTLKELLEAKLGVRTYTRINRATSAVGVAVGRVLLNSPNRVSAVLVNLSANTIYVSPDGSPSATHGIRLGPSGGSLILKWDEDFSLCGYEWNALASGAASDIFILEQLILSGGEGE